VRAEARELDAEQARRTEALARALDYGNEVALADVADASGLQLKQGRLVRPVTGPVVGAWGVHKDSTLGIEVARRGVELRSRPGELVRAVAAGRVRFVGEMPGIGRGVALDHGDGYVTLLGHLGTLHCAVGDEVGDGDVLAEAAGSSVYLELAQGGTAIDPTHWLARR
jgi:septal ring factor EnvC (AmiA/AmiB activator)